MLPTKTCNFNWIGEQHYHCMLTFPYTKILKLLEFIDGLLLVSECMLICIAHRSALEMEMKSIFYKHQIYEVL